MLDTFLEHDVDVIQIGTRNMQNFDLLKEVGQVDVPVILKRGMSATISEWLMAAEYIAAGGNHNIILCERGIRTFETAYRNVLDVTAIAVLKRETHLPVIVDPSHAGGKAWMVPALSCAAVAAGADGAADRGPSEPTEAWCDADQALTPDEFATLMGKLDALARAIGRSVDRALLQKRALPRDACGSGFGLTRCRGRLNRPTRTLKPDLQGIMEHVDCVVIGAGAIGLAVAREAARAGREVVVVEAAGAIGTSRARATARCACGIYYPTGSLKARLCVAGRERLYAYCAEHGIVFRRCGKLIVATSDDQRAGLEALRAQAVRNGVADLVRLDLREVAAMEPALRCVDALHSPSTGIVDSHQYMLALEGDARDAGATLAFASPVTGGRVTTNGIALSIGGAEATELVARGVVNCAGMTRSALRARSPACRRTACRRPTSARAPTSVSPARHRSRDSCIRCQRYGCRAAAHARSNSVAQLIPRPISLRALGGSHGKRRRRPRRSLCDDARLTRCRARGAACAAAVACASARHGRFPLQFQAFAARTRHCEASWNSPKASSPTPSRRSGIRCGKSRGYFKPTLRRRARRRSASSCRRRTSPARCTWATRSSRR